MSPADVYHNQFVGITPAWHRLGTAIAVGTKAEEAMDKAGLSNWGVRSIPLQIEGVDTKGLRVLIREDGPDTVIATDVMVTGDYHPISNEEVFGPMIELLAGMKMDVDAAGVLGRLGNRAFMTFTAGDIEIGSGERYLRYMVALARHTGRDAVVIMPTGIRVVCANTEDLALRTARRLLTIPHTLAGMDHFYSNADSVREVLGLTEHYNTMLHKMFTRTSAVPFSPADWDAAVTGHLNRLPTPDTTRKEAIRESLARSLNTAWGIEVRMEESLGASRTSLWTAKQAISTWAQHTSAGGSSRRDARSMNIALGTRVPMVDAMNASVVRVVRSTRSTVGDTERALSWLGA